jgi:glycosyltransferase involved in cell wall biosynthesis
MRIIVEGWRFVPHSFAIANQFQLLELLGRSNLELFHRDLPYFDPEWQPQRGLFTPPEEEALSRIPAPEANLVADAVLRMVMPYNLKPSAAKRTCVFATTEWGIVQKLMLQLMGVPAFWDAHHNSDTIIVTPSHWSRQGFLRSGADPDRVVVVPHGVDTRVFYPLAEDERVVLRQQRGLENCFVFLNIGVMTWNKGIRPLLKAFAAVVERYPQVRLILKGTEAIRTSRDFIVDAIHGILTKAQAAQVIPRIAYIGDNLSSRELAQLHQVADAYVTPYLAEGFNMPVLEAAACGLPIVCTRGGPTDDFTRSDFALYINSELKTMEIEHETRFYLHPDLEHSIELMTKVIENSEFRSQARQAGSQFVATYYTWKHVVDQLLEILVPGSGNLVRELIVNS